MSEIDPNDGIPPARLIRVLGASNTWFDASTNMEGDPSPYPTSQHMAALRALTAVPAPPPNRSLGAALGALWREREQLRKDLNALVRGES